MDYDLVVVGGGPAGIGTAFTGAKLGLKVAIIERFNMLGGNWTNGYVLSILGVYTYSGNTKIVGGIVDEIIERLKEINGTKGKIGNFVPFRPDEMKLILDTMAKELNIDVYFSSLVKNVVVKNNRIEKIIISKKGRTKSIKAKVFVDSSGDADLAYISTKQAMIGKEDTHEHQEATLPFRIGGINEKEVIDFAKKNNDLVNVVLDDNGNLSRIKILPKLVEKYKEEQILYLPLANQEFLFNTGREGEFVCNATHVIINDFTDGKEIANAIIDARKQIISSLNFLKKEVPGFENSYLIDSAPFIGIRETRRAIGEYVLTKDDVLNNRRFDDVIARCGHPIEVHDKKKGVYYIYLNGGNDSWYEIPYRAIVVKGIDNLFAVGRCISAEFEAQASARVSGTAIAMGEAAATAAYLMIKKNVKAKEVDIKELQEMLKNQGAII